MTMMMKKMTKTTTMTMMVMTMKKTTTKEQSIVGDNRGSRIGEKRQLVGVGDDGGKSRGRQIGGVFLISTKSIPMVCSAPPRAKKGPEPNQHACWE
jgi:hypothetical protein